MKSTATKAYILLLFCFLPLHPFAVVNRYLPNTTHLTRSRQYLTRPTFTTSFSLLHASKSFSRSTDIQHPERGIPEIWGTYDLKEIIWSLEEYHDAQGNAYTSPYDREPGAAVWKGKGQLYNASSSIDVRKIEFAGHLPILDTGIELYARAPIYDVETRDWYRYAPGAAMLPSQGDLDQLDRLRISVHKDLGIQPGDWTSTKAGDVEAGISYRHSWDYAWLFRSIDLVGKIELGIPLAPRADYRYPSSIPFGNDGHFSLGVALEPSFELQEGIFFDSPLRFVIQGRKTMKRRFSVYKEPAIFSPLRDDIQISPGNTLIWRPSVTLNHLAQNLHVSLGLQLTKHWADTWYDSVRTERNPDSYLTATAGGGRNGDEITRKEQIARRLSKWDALYLSASLEYDLADYFSHLKHTPYIHLQIDHPWSGDHYARTTQITAQFSWPF